MPLLNLHTSLANGFPVLWLPFPSSRVHMRQLPRRTSRPSKDRTKLGLRGWREGLPMKRSLHGVNIIILLIAMGFTSRVLCPQAVSRFWWRKRYVAKQEFGPPIGNACLLASLINPKGSAQTHPHMLRSLHKSQGLKSHQSKPSITRRGSLMRNFHNNQGFKF